MGGDTNTVSPECDHSGTLRFLGNFDFDPDYLYFDQASAAILFLGCRDFIATFFKAHLSEIKLFKLRVVG